jgi:hypothetical protein
MSAACPDPAAAGDGGGIIARRLFGFETDFAADLRCLPMAVRRKLDLAGVKLKLHHWHGLTPWERQLLLVWPDDPTAIRTLAGWLLERSAALSGGPAGPLPPACGTPWQQGLSWPEAVLASCAQLNLSIRPEGWGELDELQRFALVKLSHPGHEHRNLPRALAEFGQLN